MNNLIYLPISGDAIRRLQNLGVDMGNYQIPLATYLPSHEWQIEQELNAAYRSACKLEDLSSALLHALDTLDPKGAA